MQRQSSSHASVAKTTPSTIFGLGIRAGPNYHCSEMHLLWSPLYFFCTFQSSSVLFRDVWTLQAHVQGSTSSVSFHKWFHRTKFKLKAVRANGKSRQVTLNQYNLKVKLIKVVWNQFACYWMWLDAVLDPIRINLNWFFPNLFENMWIIFKWKMFFRVLRNPIRPKTKLMGILTEKRLH